MADIPLSFRDEHRALPIDLFSLDLLLARLDILAGAWGVLRDLRDALLRSKAALGAPEWPILAHRLRHHLLLVEEPLIVIVARPRCDHLLSIRHVEIFVLGTAWCTVHEAVLSRLEANRLSSALARLNLLGREG